MSEDLRMSQTSQGRKSAVADRRSTASRRRSSAGTTHSSQVTIEEDQDTQSFKTASMAEDPEAVRPKLKRCKNCPKLEDECELRLKLIIGFSMFAIFLIGFIICFAIAVYGRRLPKKVPEQVAEPEAKPVEPCDVPELPEHAALVGIGNYTRSPTFTIGGKRYLHDGKQSPTDTKTDTSAAIPTKIDVNASVEYICQLGYKHQGGDTSRTCREGKHLDGTPIKCVLVELEDYCDNHVYCQLAGASANVNCTDCCIGYKCKKGCPPGWGHHGAEFCYKFFATRVTGDLAKSKCEQENSILAMPKNGQQNEALKRMPKPGKKDIYVWIGLREYPGHVYKFLDGTRIGSGTRGNYKPLWGYYSNWSLKHNGQPDGNEPCTLFEDGGKWFDMKCNHNQWRKGYICQRNP